MAQFDASINLNVNSSKAEQQVKRLEAAVDKVNRTASKLDFNSKNLDKAATAAERLYKTLEKIESAALSKLPTSVQTLIAYLKAANVATAKLTANAVGAAVGFKQISGVNFAPIIKQEKEVRDLLLEIIQVQVKFMDAARNFRPRLSGQNPFQYILDGLNLVQVKIIETERLLRGFGTNLNRLGGAGGGRGGSGGGGGGGFGLPPDLPKLPPNNQKLIDNANTIRGLQNIRTQLVDLLETATIGTRVFRLYEDQIAQVNNKIRDAQLLGQRGGSGVAMGSRGATGLGGFINSRRGRDALTGFGFPLLFGGGIGQAVAGGIGGFAGGLGGSIVASALVAKAAEFANATAEAGQALDIFSGDITKIGEVTGIAGSETIKYAKALEDMGLKTAGLQLAAQQTAKIIGSTGVGALQLFGEESKELSGNIARLGLKTQAFFAQATVGLVELINKALNALGLGAPAENTAGARELINRQASKFTGKELDILRQEYEIKKLISEEDVKQKAVLEARLALSKNELDFRKSRSEQGLAVLNDDFGALVKAEQEEKIIRAKREILKLELKQAEAAEQVFNKYNKQVQALSRINLASKLRLTAEKATIEAQSSLASAFFGAQLKINDLFMQRAVREKDILRIRDLEIQKANIIYNQTLAQVRADLERVKLKARQVELATRELQVKNLTKLAEGKLNDADKAALAVQKQALQLAIANVQVTETVSRYLLIGAEASRVAAIEAAQFTYQQTLAAQAAERTAAAVEKTTRAREASNRETYGLGSDRETYGLGSSPNALGGGSNFGLNQRARNAYDPNPALELAQGGYVTGPTSALIGEGGENEYVVPESKMQSSMARYARGMRGSSVTEGGSTEGGGNAIRGTMVSINTGPVMRMNNKDYVTVSDLNNAVSSMASAMSNQQSSRGYGGQARVS